MDLQIFLDFNSNDENKRENSYSFFLEQLENSNFIFNLFINLKNSTNPLLINIFQLAILECIRKKWSMDSTFWNFEELKFIQNSLIEFLFNDNFEDKSHLIETFRFIILNSDFFIIELIQEFYDLIEQKINSFKDLYIIFKILTFWSKKYSISILNDEDKINYEETIENLNLLLIK